MALNWHVIGGPLNSDEMLLDPGDPFITNFGLYAVSANFAVFNPRREVIWMSGLDPMYEGSSVSPDGSQNGLIGSGIGGSTHFGGGGTLGLHYRDVNPDPHESNSVHQSSLLLARGYTTILVSTPTEHEGGRGLYQEFEMLPYSTYTYKLNLNYPYSTDPNDYNITVDVEKASVDANGGVSVNIIGEDDNIIRPNVQGGADTATIEITTGAEVNSTTPIALKFGLTPKIERYGGTTANHLENYHVSFELVSMTQNGHAALDDSDTDHDGLSDSFETTHGFDPNDYDEDDNGIFDGFDDWDNDGLTNREEQLAGSNPLVGSEPSTGPILDPRFEGHGLQNLDFSVNDGASPISETNVEFANENLSYTSKVYNESDIEHWNIGEVNTGQPIELHRLSDGRDYATASNVQQNFTLPYFTKATYRLHTLPRPEDASINEFEINLSSYSDAFLKIDGRVAVSLPVDGQVFSTIIDDPSDSVRSRTIEIVTSNNSSLTTDNILKLGLIITPSGTNDTYDSRFRLELIDIAVQTPSDPTNPDSDGDGLSDDFENDNGFDPSNPDEDGNGVPDGYDDADGDGSTNGEEEDNGTDPRENDSDDNQDSSEIVGIINPAFEVNAGAAELKSFGVGNNPNLDAAIVYDAGGIEGWGPINSEESNSLEIHTIKGSNFVELHSHFLVKNGPVARGATQTFKILPGTKQTYILVTNGKGGNRADNDFTLEVSGAELSVDGTNVASKQLTSLEDENTYHSLEIEAPVVEGAPLDYPIDVKISFTPSSSDATAGTRVRVIPVEMVLTDITGFRGIGETPAGEVPRIDSDIEPDGIACDWQEDVDDGAMLLVRLIASKGEDLEVNFGHLDTALEFKEDLPAEPMREGKYIEVTQADEPLLQALGIEIEGDLVGENKEVYGIKIYRSPNEFDLATPLNSEKEREIALAVDVEAVDSEPVTVSKDITLVRPPLVLVHGVNSDPDTWLSTNPGTEETFVDVFENSAGFVCRDFRVNHNTIDPNRKDDLTTKGFGEISSMYTFVRDMVTDSTQKFRDKNYFEGKRIAVQKVDVVAHSYGGLLTRWYIEMTGEEFEGRRDVRKIITLGSPHKGSPLANMVCEIYSNDLIGEAETEGIFTSHEIPLIDFLAEQEEALPTRLLESEDRPRHAYQVFSVNSERLEQMNTTPLHDDIGYATVSGTFDNLDVLNGFGGGLFILVPFRDLAPIQDLGLFSNEENYFPWMKLFSQDGVDIDGNDGIVPTWSSVYSTIEADRKIIERVATNAFFSPNHVQMTGNNVVYEACREFLNNKRSRGAAHRAEWIEVPASERNAYKGSVVNTGSEESVGGGLNPDAIVKVELEHGSTKSLTMGVSGDEVGIRYATLTGMTKTSDLGNEEFTLISDETGDETLTEMGKLQIPTMNIPLEQYAGVGPDNYVTFSVRNVRYGRNDDNEAVGPDGESGNEDCVHIAYEYDGLPSGQSPSTKLIIEDYYLPAPVKQGSGLDLTLKGSVEVTDADVGSQNVKVDVVDEDLGPDVHFERLNFVLNHPQDAWDGVLIPYETNTSLFLNRFGSVQGNNNTTNEASTDVYQYLVRPGLIPNVESTTIQVP